MVSEYELNGVDCDPFKGPFLKPLDRPLTDEEIKALADDDLRNSVELSEPVTLPPVAEIKLCLQCKLTTVADMYCPDCTRALYAVHTTFTGEP